MHETVSPCRVPYMYLFINGTPPVPITVPFRYHRNKKRKRDVAPWYLCGTALKKIYIWYLTANFTPNVVPWWNPDVFCCGRTLDDVTVQYLYLSSGSIYVSFLGTCVVPSVSGTTQVPLLLLFFSVCNVVKSQRMII